MELRILELLAHEGLSSAMIAKKINRKHDHVRYAFDRILMKLGAKRMPQAIYNAMKEGIIK